MSTQTTDANTLRAIALSLPDGFETATLERIAANLDSDAKRFADSAKLQEIGRNAASCIADMANALECDYDRLETLRAERDEWIAENPGKYLDPKDSRNNWALAYPDEAEELAELNACAGDCEDREDAEQRIREDPLEIELAGKWTLGETPTADRAIILLSTGGPATRIVCELDANMEPHRAWLEVQDWFQPWTEYTGDAVSSEQLLTYCSCFYFGE